MKNIIEILKGLGVELTEEQTASLNTEVSANYKTVAEFEKKVARLETERDGYKAQLDTATESLKGFDGVDIESLKKQVADSATALKDAEDKFKAQLAERDFEDALRGEISHYNFTSASARDAILAKVKAKNLPLVDGKIIGLSEVMEQIKKDDAEAFKSEQTPPAQFTSPMSHEGGTKYQTKDEILKIKDATERQQAIRDNINLFLK